MPFELKNVDPAKDFAELIECEWVSYENPIQTFFRLFCPIHGDGPGARAEWLQECTARQRAWHESDPTSVWQKVVDTDSGKIVGGALWKICEQNPFAHEEEGDHEVTWYPPDSTREFVSQALEQFDMPRSRMAQRPQVYLNIIFTHPDYRRKGVAQMMLDWGIQKAKELDVECWLDATVHGVPLYQKNGFTVMNENNLRPETAHPDDKWRRIEAELLPMTLWQMWLRKDGPYEEGKTTKPWERS